MLADGTYDVFVVDANAVHGSTTALHLDLTVVSGERKGEVVSLTADQLGVDELDALGMPATLTVDGGIPTLVIDG